MNNWGGDAKSQPRANLESTETDRPAFQDYNVSRTVLLEISEGSQMAIKRQHIQTLEINVVNPWTGPRVEFIHNVESMTGAEMAAPYQAIKSVMVSG